MIHIDDVVKIDEKKKRIKKEIYTKIYEQFSAKIRQSVELGHKQVFLTVPVILIGYPVFDRSAAARYIARQFSLGGFVVQLVSDHDIYVSWNVKKKKKEKVEEEEEDFPNLMNLKKIANKYRRTA
jgi:MoxR-like ATPase